MSEKHIVVQGATCKCILSEEPLVDILKVKTQSKHYANEKGGENKIIATTKEIGQTFKKNTVGKCRNQPSGSNFLRCQINITKWSNFHEKITLSNGGNILLEDSKATCAMGVPDCIEIIDHGQIAEPSTQNFKNADPDVQNRINPLLNLSDAGNPKFDFNGIEQI